MFDGVLDEFDASASRFVAAAEAVRLETAFDDAVTPDHFGRLTAALSDVVAAFGLAQQRAFRELREAVDGEGDGED
jgi:hypothetical protein